MSIMYKLISYKDNDEISFNGWEKPLHKFPIFGEGKIRLSVFEQLAEGEGVLKKRLDIFKDLSGEWNEEENSNEDQETTSDQNSEVGRYSSEGSPVDEVSIGDELSFIQEASSDDGSSKSIITVTELEETVFGIRKSTKEIKKGYTIKLLKNEVEKKWRNLSNKNLTSNDIIDNLSRWLDESNISLQFNRVRSNPVKYRDLGGKDRYFYLTNWMDPKFYTCLDATKIPFAKDFGKTIEARPTLKISKEFKYDLQFEAPYIEGVNNENDKSVAQAKAIEKKQLANKKNI